MKILNGAELAGYITERQARQVRALRQAHGVHPQLALIVTTDDPVVSRYVSLKQAYGEDILVDVTVFRVAQSAVAETITQLNEDEAVHGIVLQLPLEDPSQTDELVALIAPEKDVDGLGTDAHYPSATAIAIDWLLAGYNVDLKHASIAIVGQGRLVGKPLAALWETTGYDVSVYNDTTEDLQTALRGAQVIVTATGQPGLITEHMLQPSAVVVDAGTASENGKIVGDVADTVREMRDDLTITPVKGGVGPLTIVALFDAVIQAATAVADTTD
jgi:methylenetetrahydrofolate dehydrogenase (NADP+) / methenyltetrahydrofolate cyclohydrolase